jgi:hypothetical protein
MNNQGGRTHVHLTYGADECGSQNMPFTFALDLYSRYSTTHFQHECPLGHGWMHTKVCTGRHGNAATILSSLSSLLVIHIIIIVPLLLYTSYLIFNVIHRLFYDHSHFMISKNDWYCYYRCYQYHYVTICQYAPIISLCHDHEHEHEHQHK